MDKLKTILDKRVATVAQKLQTLMLNKEPYNEEQLDALLQTVHDDMDCLTNEIHKAYTDCVPKERAIKTLADALDKHTLIMLGYNEAREETLSNMNKLIGK